ncbi:fatty acid desaturase-domain-containing protein [Xylariaceae sp. FL1019]|nr:fatty acid desaturase-domain-containing protein [Xylariaceae sp. FL1019]
MASTTQTAVAAHQPRQRELRMQANEQAFPDMNTIRKAIPAHCFVPSTSRSLGYVARDLAMAGGLTWAALSVIPMVSNPTARAVCWAVYGFLQGLVGVGIWILAHECGHGAFSVHRRLNDVVGWVLHSLLLVPFFSWKFSHARHHRFTGHLEKDMAFVPSTRPQLSHDHHLVLGFIDPEVFEDAPIVNLAKLIAHQLGGWQAYLLFNVSAADQSLQNPDAKWWRRGHFDPFSGVFRPSEAVYIALSDLGLALMGAGIWYGAKVLGWDTMFLLYGVPYFWVHHWLVAITYLHHNHPDVPHYEGSHWSFVAGALATVDRDFGFIGRHVFHGIIDTHVVHHLFSKIPFYHAEEATKAIKPLLGDLYHADEQAFMGSLWTTWNTCKYVEKDPSNPGAMRWAR